MALQRGPLVYCAESPDNPGISVRDLALERDAELSIEYAPGTLGGITVIKGRAHSQREHNSPGVNEFVFTAIPYYAWANRGPSEMAVWFNYDK